MISTLAVVVILGVIVTIVVANGGTPSNPRTSISGTPGDTTTTTGPSSIGSDATAAAISSCLGNYAIVESAISDYQSLENSTPPAGTAWATSASGGPILQSWPSDPGYYTLSWNGHLLSVIPEHGAASHGNTGTSSPPTGCHAA
ncbi:MAG TPA: hypothetical protein VMF33_06655 [Acidimicrobiales bacterium]|nr:hypothetical protein [Acidimicrobiales bacterium]